jgi:7-cyano-7-deazaguanine synthase in queuosine biosynthesis
MRASRVFVRRSGTETNGCTVILQPAANLQTGESKFKKLFGSLTTLEADLLLIASTIFAVDRCIRRGDREDFVRGIEVSVPLVNIGRLHPLLSILEDLLRTLSNDAWRLIFRQDNGKPEPQMSVQDTPGSTLLFSGGLDSLAAAIELGPQASSLQLVSHTTRNQRTSVVQDELLALLKGIGIEPPHRKFQVSAVSKAPSAHLSFDSENSQRARSFLYLTLGVLCARRAGHSKVIYIAENGQMAIHLPLTHARIGAFSTHTAHPEVLAKAEKFFSEALNLELHILNPYVHRTKAEVTKIVWDRLPSAISTAISCWKTSRLTGDATHCGICIPCIIRRIAIECQGADTTKYERDLFSEAFADLPEDDDGRRNLADLGEFALRVERYSEIEMMSEWPELYSSKIVRSDVIHMYKRAAAETRRVLGSYPSVAPVLL